MTRTVAIIQARTGSTRLPSKVTMPLAGRPMVEVVVERASRARGIDELVLAVPDLRVDDVLARIGTGMGVRVVRGDAEDVLSRYHVAAGASNADVIVRVTADCPLLSPSVLADVVALRSLDDADYASNTIAPRTYPRGLDVEAFTRGALEIAHREAREHEEREHVTPFLWRRPERFRTRALRGTEDLSGHRWTVDTAQDMAFARRVFDHFGGNDFEWWDILEAVRRHPEWEELNRDVPQKEVG